MAIDPLARRTARRVLKVWRECDPAAKEAATRMHATCTKGCAACCNLLVLVSFAEAVTIAERLATDAAWQGELPALLLRIAAQLPLYDEPANVTNDSHFARQVPCVFLGEGDLCRIYDVRPTNCRYHTVVSDPADCSYGAAVPTVTAINLHHLRGRVFEVISHAREAGGLDLVAPLPVVMFAALAMILDSTRGLAESLPSVVKLRALSLHTWLGVEG